ncbi:glycoside hydrolase family 53 protein [Maribellus mangrovi]|uniref:glycoside hydrolase family 53 protein n=1 Tax=Maribellus mangrovi TaxID=3133146 RepID=UPI0030ED3453
MNSNINNLLIAGILLFMLAGGCSKDETPDPEPPENEKTFISSVDISRYPEIMLSDPVFYDQNNREKDMLTILKESGVNTIRLKLWIDPADGHAGFAEVKQFSQTLHSKGFKTWLTVHYSDTWADPGKQETPARWQNLDYPNLMDSMSAYTTKVVEEMSPDFIQIGNEINSGFMHPIGNSNNFDQFKALLDAGIEAVRNTNSTTKIMLHYAGFNGASLFYNKLKDLDFDIIGLSYYPWWHGKDISKLESTMKQLSTSYDKDIIVAETSYPFTFEWNDWTNNIIGTEDQLILPDYPATSIGQQEFIRAIRTISWENVEHGLGFSYWGGEQIAWKGPEGTDASPWENLALFDFNNKALPVLNEFDSE